MSHPTPPSPAVPSPEDGLQQRSVAIIGAGRMGGAIAAGLRRGGHAVVGPLSRDYSAGDLRRATVVLLAVPDRQIAAAARALLVRLDAAGEVTPVIGHCSGATGLTVLLAAAQDRPLQAFSLHPLMTVPAGQTAPWAGAAAAVAGSTPQARAVAASLARDLDLEPVVIADGDRAAYHAAAAIASNFLITLEAAAERVAATAGLDRARLVPLVRQSVENWAQRGAGALTGPIARGDELTVKSQRAAVGERAPELLALFDALADATRRLARAPRDPVGFGAAAAEPEVQVPV